MMELRYLGFEQNQNSRAYRFDVIEKGSAVRRFVVTADLALFLTHRVGIQEGPNLCAQKLEAGLKAGDVEIDRLTEEDLRAHTDARTQALARKAEARRPSIRRLAAASAAHSQSPWRKPGN
jgi:hypothetical protein